MSVQRAEEPSWVSLNDDEELLWVGHRSWWSVARWVIFGIALIIFGGVASILLPRVTELDPAMALATLVLAVVGVFIIGYAFAQHRSVSYAITENEVYEKHGIISNNITQIPFSRVQNTEMNLGPMERLLKFGDVTVRTAGTDSPNIVLINVPSPNDVHNMIADHLDTQNEGL